jgi:hypothetical protein
MHRVVMPICFAAIATPAAAADLTLHRVMLSAAGVGYFEYGAHVDGPASLGLDVPLDQVDDVLRSLAVFDSQGGVGSIELPGRDNTHAAFADVPFGPAALTSPAALLDSLRGEEIAVSGPSAMTGRIVGTVAENVAPAATSPVPETHTRVTLLTADGLKQFILEDATAVRLTDAALRDRFGASLDAARQQSAASKRHLVLRSEGSAARDVTVGYVAVVPLWKASYRVVLPSQDGGRARVQGWAVLENQSGADWHGVDLTLQSGNPVTFHQAIYASYFADRPEVPVEVLGRLLPDADTRATAPMQAAAEAAPPPAFFATASGTAGTERVIVQAQRRLGAKLPAFDGHPLLARPVGDADLAAAPQATETPIDTSFHIATPIDLARGHTASVPIVDRDIPAEQLDWLQLYSTRPVAALRIKNDTGLSLPAGVLTLYQQGQGGTAFAGDARLSGLPAGESRLLAFAEDLKTHAARLSNAQQTTFVGVKMSHGVLTNEVRYQREYLVTVTAPATEKRRVLIEFPNTPHATFSLPGSGLSVLEETDTARRVLVALKPNETRTIRAVEETPGSIETALLLDGGQFDDQVVAAVLTQGTLDAAARAKLQGLMDLRTTESTKQAALQRLTSEQDGVAQDEDRLRKNLAAVTGPGNFHDQLLNALAADEAKLSSLAHAIAQAQTESDHAHDALAGAVSKLEL